MAKISTPLPFSPNWFFVYYIQQAQSSVISIQFDCCRSKWFLSEQWRISYSSGMCVYAYGLSVVDYHHHIFSMYVFVQCVTNFQCHGYVLAKHPSHLTFSYRLSRRRRWLCLHICVDEYVTSQNIYRICILHTTFNENLIFESNYVRSINAVSIAQRLTHELCRWYD